MKKKILSGIFALALLISTGYGVSKSMKSNAGLSDLALMNVEALAQTESGNGFDCLKPSDAVCYADWNNAIRYLGHKSTISI
jgi:hypothetical protein